MKKIKVKKIIDPITGRITEKIQLANIFVYGLTEEQKEVLMKSLPEKEIEITDITGDANCIVEKSDFAVVINTDNITEDEFDFFVEFYRGYNDSTETIILLGSRETMKNKFDSVKTVYYKDKFMLERNMKYDLLKAYQKTTKSDGYSEKLAMLLKILFAIRNNPYITTKELAVITERTDRTIQRYIETLRCAGEFIGYDRQKKGWYLMVEGKSVLMNEI